MIGLGTRDRTRDSDSGLGIGLGLGTRTRDSGSGREASPRVRESLVLVEKASAPDTVRPTKNSPNSAYSALTSSNRMSVTIFLNDQRVPREQRHSPLPTRRIRSHR